MPVILRDFGRIGKDFYLLSFIDKSGPLELSSGLFFFRRGLIRTYETLTYTVSLDMDGHEVEPSPKLQRAQSSRCD